MQEGHTEKNHLTPYATPAEYPEDLTFQRHTQETSSPVQSAELGPLNAEREDKAAAAAAFERETEREREKAADTLQAPHQPKPTREQSEREPH